MTTAVSVPGAFADKKLVNAGSTFAPLAAGKPTDICAGLTKVVAITIARAVSTPTNLIPLFITVHSVYVVGGGLSAGGVGRGGLTTRRGGESGGD